jgi:hypothetical protein
VNSISLNGVFTATYNNYRIVINAVSSSTSPGLQLRARNAGTDNTGATEYLSQNVYTADTGNPTRATSTGSSQTLGVLGNTVAVSIVDICDPFLSTQTFYIGTTYNRNTSDLRLDLIAGNRITAASQDGLTVFPATGNFTGKIRVYGYKN